MSFNHITLVTNGKQNKTVGISQSQILQKARQGTFLAFGEHIMEKSTEYAGVCH